MERHNPEVVIFDLSPPYDANWTFFKTMRDAKTMRGRGVVLTTTNKNRLDEVLGEDSMALEVVGRAKDLAEIDAAIREETRKAKIARDLLPSVTTGHSAWQGIPRVACARQASCDERRAVAYENWHNR